MQQEREGLTSLSAWVTRFERGSTRMKYVLIATCCLTLVAFIMLGSGLIPTPGWLIPLNILVLLLFVMMAWTLPAPVQRDASPTPPSQAELESLDTLELFAHDKSLQEVLLWVAKNYESKFPGLCSILLLDAEGKHLKPGAGPSLPVALLDAVDGLAIGPRVGSCGTAAYLRQTIIVTDIARDPLWQDYKQLALVHGLHACWSVPMYSSRGEVLGTFAIYYREPHAPSASELRAVEHIADLVGVVIERQALVRKLSESEKRYRELFQSSPLPILVFDQETLKFLAVNNAASSHYGYAQDEFMALTITDIRPPEDVPAVLQAVARRVEGTNDVGLWRHRVKNGRLIWVRIFTYILEFKGRPAKMVLVNDVTELLATQRQVEDMNVTLEKRIQERTAELASKSKELESFCYSVSHDLKAPLRGIDGYSRLLMDDHASSLSAEGKKFLHNIRTATQHMTNLIDDLLTYSREERRQQTIQPINLRQLVAEQLERMAAASGAVDLQMEVASVEVLADKDALQIALRNLLDNAIKFSSQSAAPMIRISTTLSEARCVLMIQDNGVGFDMRFYGRLFEIFQRLHRADEFSGTGIGLAMVRKVMERCGGRVWGESQAGQGARFYIELPLAITHADAGGGAVLAVAASP